VLLASMSGYSPTVAVEFGRKVVFSVDRPSFDELEDAVRATKEKPAAADGAPDAVPTPA
jgi:chemotaxis protein MotA